MLPRLVVPGVGLLCVLCAPSHADDWLQFRGPDGQGHAVSGRAPVNWSESENVAWKVPVEGRGWSSPVVLGDQVWLTAAVETAATSDELRAALARDGTSVPSPYLARHVVLKAICVDRQTGRRIHTVTLFDVDEPVLLCSVNSYASPTPVAEPGRLYCDFGAMGTACLDTETGKTLWVRQLKVEHQVGPGSSPIVHGDLLILTRDGCDQQYVAALDKQSGATVWKAKRPPMAAASAVQRKAFSTPLVIEHNGHQQMVVPAAQWMVSYNPATGQELWRVDTGPTFSNSARPVYGLGLVFCGTAYGGSYLVAIRPDGRRDVTQTHVEWQTKRSVPKRSSPLLVGTAVYMVSDTGVASCLDARTGELRWAQRLGGSFSASPVAAGDRIYFFGEEGTTTVIEPGGDFTQVAQNALDGHIMSTPAFVDNAIVLRTDTHLYSIQSRPRATAASAVEPAGGGSR